MLTEERIRRRDPRFPVSAGRGSIELDSGSGRREAALLDVSASGLAFEWSSDEKLEPNTTLCDVLVRLGGHYVAGDLIVRGGLHRVGALRSYGALFYPGTLSDARTWERALQDLGGFPEMRPSATGEPA